jgi:flagellar biosynthetic protein FlhB
MSNDASEKTEPASEYKLREARNKGNVWKSSDLMSVIMIVSALLFLSEEVVGLIEQSKTVFKNAFSISVYHMGEREITGLLSSLVELVFHSLIPVWVFIVIVAIAVNLIQSGFVFSFDTLTPKISRLNPIEGAKKLFSKQKLFDLVKTSLKLIFISVIFILYVKGNLEFISSFSRVHPSAHVEMVLELVSKLVVILLVPLALVAVVDVYHSKTKYMSDLKMSKYEVKEEYKRKEGDPEIKSKRKKISEELKQRGSSLSRVGDSDVVITNPTHIAILLKFDEATMMAPKIIGMGADVFANKLMVRARVCGVPLVSNITLARRLYQEDIDSYIPSECFKDVAMIYNAIESRV